MTINKRWVRWLMLLRLLPKWYRIFRRTAPSATIFYVLKYTFRAAKDWVK